MILDNLDPKEWLQLNSQLQQKKNALRADLNQRGILQKDKVNNFDNYKYFSEAGYKKLFTELFSKHRLEIKSSEVGCDTFDGTQKQPFGRKVTIEFTLIDCDTGFFETSIISGEGMDKGDKAGYKADTGALKYYFANTFMVATGDDAENGDENPRNAPNKTKETSKKQPIPEPQMTVEQALEIKINGVTVNEIYKDKEMRERIPQIYNAATPEQRTALNIVNEYIKESRTKK